MLNARSLENQDFRSPAVDRAMNLFELLAESQSGLTLSQVSRKLEIPKSTVHCLLYTLVTRGYIQRAADGRRYSLGLRFADVARSNCSEEEFRNLVLPFLRQIVQKLGLTATVAVRRLAEAVIIARVASPYDDGGGAWIGRHIDLHSSAQGKALIAGLSSEEIDRLFMNREFAKFTQTTIASLTNLKNHLAEVRVKGFAVNDEEMVAGVRAVAAPVVDPSGSVVASLTVRGNCQQIPRTLIPQIAREVVFVSREITTRMSCDWV